MPSVEFLGEPLAWSEHLDILGVRLDRRLHFYPHAVRLAARVAPRILALRRLMAVSRRIPAWIGILLYKVMIRSVLTYAAPVVILANLTAERAFQRTENRGLRAAMRRRLVTPVMELHTTSRVPFLKDEMRRLAADLLWRLWQRRAYRILRAFIPERPQHPRRVRWDTPLERAYAGLEEARREPIREWLRGELRNRPPPTR